MVIVLHLSRNGCVVITPIVPGNGAIVEFVTKGRKENNENVVESQRAIDDSGMVRSLKVLFKFLCYDDSSFVGIEFRKSLCNDSLTSFVWLATDSGQKFVKIDETVLRCIKVIEENFAGVEESVTRKIVYENAARLYDIDLG